MKSETALPAAASGVPPALRRWKRYPAYRDSGVEWLGEIPEHWAVKRLRFVLRVNPAQGYVSLPPDAEVSFVPMEAISEDGHIDLQERRPVGEVAASYTHFCEGDILVAKITPCFENGKGALAKGLAGGVGFGTTELHVLRPHVGTLAMYVYYLTSSHPFRSMGIATMQGAAGQKRVTDRFVRDFRLGVPSLPEQRAIAAFLDRETGKIDTLVAKKEQLIELLQEKRAAVISHAVTKGLDPDAPTRDSGIASLGKTPAHWEVRRNKQIFREVDERSTAGDEELLTVSHITGVTARSEKEVYMFLAESMEGYKKVREGDLVVNTMWAWMGALGISGLDGIVSPSYHVYRPSSRHEPAYLGCLYRTPAYVCEIGRHSKGVWSSRLRLYPDEFFEILTVTPPVSEQKAIVEHVAAETEPIDDLVETVGNHIDRLREFRAALISAAVTGKIDVRDEVK